MDRPWDVNMIGPYWSTVPSPWFCGRMKLEVQTRQVPTMRSFQWMCSMRLCFGWLVTACAQLPGDFTKMPFRDPLTYHVVLVTVLTVAGFW